jgi:hypothetical protein
MAVKFDNSGTKYVKWTAPSGVVGLVSKTICFTYIHTADPAAVGTILAIFDGTGTDSDEYNAVFIPNGSPKKLRFLAHFSTTDGVWTTTNNVLTVGAEHKIEITYNGAATTNDPIIYVDGVAVAITETTTPVGTYRSGTTTDLYVGTPSASINPNGEVEDLRIYSGIKSATQAAVIAAEDIETDITIDESSLVFHASLTMCKGYTYATFAGQTLAAANTFFDRIAGLLGVPSGSPLGA